jgi:hypothetical protein
LLRCLLGGVALTISAVAAHATDAADAGVANLTLEEVVVSARKREEPLEKAPLAVTVVTDTDLQRTYTGSLVDIASAAPNLLFHTVGEFGHSSSLDVRGVGGGGANFDSDPAVARAQRFRRRDQHHHQEPDRPAGFSGGADARQLRAQESRCRGRLSADQRVVGPRGSGLDRLRWVL